MEEKKKESIRVNESQRNPEDQNMKSFNESEMRVKRHPDLIQE